MDPITASGSAGIAVQTDGKIILVGRAIWRLNADGAPDGSFNGTGKVSIEGDGYFVDVAIDGNGDILAGGTLRVPRSGRPGSGNRDYFYVRRVHSDGTNDAAVYAAIRTDEGADDTCNAMALQGDGKAVLAGRSRTSGFSSYDFCLQRRNSDLSADSAFDIGSSGVGVVTDFTIAPPVNSDDYLEDVVLQADGKIVAAGWADGGIAVARYRSDGMLDMSFNGTGKVITNATNGFETGYCAAVQSDGKILVGGDASYGIDGATVLLVRYNVDGSLDASFNNTGVVETDVGFRGTARSIALQSDGRIVVAGAADGDFLTARYNPNGSLEGFVKTDFGTGNDAAFCATTQNDGKILVGGSRDSVVAVARYLPGDPAVPYGEIAVEYPAGVNVNSGAVTADFGPVLSGSNKSLTFTIKNQGNGDLTPLSATKVAAGIPGDFTLGGLPASIPAGGSATLSVTFTPSAAGTRTATLEIASNDVNENPFVINLTGSQATASEAWRQEHFGSPYNTGPGADLNDADHDGIVNILEFATATDPLAYTPFPGTLVKNGSTLEFTYTRRKAALGEMTFVREFSENLSSPWSSVGGTVETILSDDGVVQQVKTTVPAGVNGKRFVRLRVTRLPP